MEKPRWMEERVGHPSELNVRTRWELQGRVRGQARALCCRWGPCVSYCEGFSVAHPCAASYRQVKQEAQPLPQMQVHLDPHTATLEMTKRNVITSHLEKLRRRAQEQLR